MQRLIDVVLDIDKKSKFKGLCNQYDDIMLDVQILEDENPKILTDCEVIIYGRKPDNTLIIQNTDITVEENRIKANLQRDFTKLSGSTKIQLTITSEGKQVSSFIFSIDVTQALTEGTEVSENVVTIIELLEEKITEGKETAEALSKFDGLVADTAGLRESIARGEEIQNELTSSINTAGEVKSELMELSSNLENKDLEVNTTIGNATEKNATLNETISEANTTKTTLDEIIFSANSAKGDLSSVVSSAIVENGKLENVIERGASKNTELNDTITNANNVKKTLDNSITSANASNKTLNDNVINATAKSAELNSNIAEATNKIADLSETILNLEDIDLDGMISSAATAKSNLEPVVSNANTAKRDLEPVISNANTAKSNLEPVISDANTAKSNLDTSISNANTAKSDLETVVSDANEVKNDLDTSISNANTAKSNLDKSISNANTAKSELETSKASAVDINQQLKNTMATGEGLGQALSDTINEGGTLGGALNDTIREAIEVGGSLSGVTDDANTAKTNLDNSISTANSKKSELETTIGNANTAKTDLDDSISSANTAKTDLDGSISSANTAKTDLDGSISLANTAKTNLDGTVSTANTTNQTLSETVTQATTKNTELNTAITDGEVKRAEIQELIDTVVEAGGGGSGVLKMVNLAGDIADVDNVTTYSTKKIYLSRGKDNYTWFSNENGVIGFNASTYINIARRWNKDDPTFYSDHLYYAHVAAKCASSNISQKMVYEGKTISDSYDGKEYKGNSNIWYSLSGLFYPDASSNWHEIRFVDSYYNDEVDCWYKNLIVLDLTATFGAGNEPDKDLLDKIFISYDGDMYGEFELQSSLIDSADVLMDSYTPRIQKKYSNEWIFLTLLNEFTGTLKCRMDEFGIVEIMGYVNGGTIDINKGAIIANLPSIHHAPYSHIQITDPSSTNNAGYCIMNPAATYIHYYKAKNETLKDQFNINIRYTSYYFLDKNLFYKQRQAIPNEPEKSNE